MLSFDISGIECIVCFSVLCRSRQALSNEEGTESFATSINVAILSEARGMQRGRDNGVLKVEVAKRDQARLALQG